MTFYLIFAVIWMFSGIFCMGAKFVTHEAVGLLCLVIAGLNILAYHLKDLRNMADEANAQQTEQTELLKKQNQILIRQNTLLRALNKKTEEQSKDSNSTNEDM